VQAYWIIGTMATLVHITDLHLDQWPNNLAAMLDLVRDIPADLFLIGGDNGSEDGLAKTVAALRELRPAAAIAWIMGNHDLWFRPYNHLWSEFKHVPATSLELENLETDFYTVTGTYGHYDYSGGTSELSHEQYETFTDGYHIWNDRYIDRLGKTNPQIAREIADRFQTRLATAVSRGLPVIVLTHTWPFAPTEAHYRSFTSAYCCNQLIGDLLLSTAIKPHVLFCGHTHQPARWDEFGFPIVNTGSDYREVRVTRWEIPAASGGLAEELGANTKAEGVAKIADLKLL
jgi:3',5'-cyclic AMP phosphodiesterase CpdA